MTSGIKASVKTYTDEFIDERGKQIHCYYWAPTQSPRAVVHISHGYTEHCMVYGNLAVELARRNFFVFAHDHVGHGKSDGSRANFSSMFHLEDNVQFHIELMKKKYPNLPIFLCGHSMGGALSIGIALSRPKDIRGLILIAPALVPNPETATPFKLFLANIFSRVIPDMPIGYADYSLVCRDSANVKHINKDPLRHHGFFKARPAVNLINYGKNVIQRKEQLSVPFLLLHGDADKLCNISGSELLYQHSSSTDKTLKIYTGGYHCLHLEPEGIDEDVSKRIIEWLEDRS